jgi:hypothetical protein
MVRTLEETAMRAAFGGTQQSRTPEIGEGLSEGGLSYVLTEATDCQVPFCDAISWVKIAWRF